MKDILMIVIGLFLIITGYECLGENPLLVDIQSWSLWAWQYVAYVVLTVAGVCVIQKRLIP